jgi:hypothetical protein
MRPRRTTSIALLVSVTFGCGLFASVARADWDDGYRHAWHPQDGWARPEGPPSLIVTPQASDTARHTAYDTPPPVAYAPRPAHDEPDVSFGLTDR